MKNFFKSSVLALLGVSLLFTSCNDDEEVLNAIGDVYIIKKLENEEMVYATAYYLYANKSLTGVTVTTPNGEEINLGAYSGGSWTYYLDPEETDYTTDLPEEGDFVFDVNALSGEKMTIDDFLEFDDLSIPEITEVSYDSEKDSYTVSWEAVEGCAGYVVRLLTSTGDLIFASRTIDKDAEEVEINGISGSWTESPSNGTTYVLEIQSFAYESNITFESLGYNLKEITIGEGELIWGE